jgi:hypothetical protein
MAALSAAVVDTAVPLQLCCITIIVNGHVRRVAGAEDLGRPRERFRP